MRDLKTFRLLLVLFAVAATLTPTISAQLPPRLDIQTAPSGHVIVQWPVGDGLYALEERAALNQGIVWQPTAQAPLLLTATFQLELAPTNRTRFFRLSQIVQPDPGVVPEPEGQATLPPLNMAESFSDSTSFLYSGTNSVQLGVAPGTIVPQRASVVRGRVLKKDGSALPGVHVRVLNHPELGFTYTRADGMFDLGVNGGPQYTIDFQLRGYCPSQRQIDAPAQDFRCLEDVMLVSADPIATVVSFGTAAPLQVAKSSVNTDKAGSRSATVLFPPGTCATVLLADGSTQNCAGLTIRATEFTVGPNGPKAMPGPLPRTSAYTYAVDLSGDEATAAGAKTVKFNQFVHVYVDNFLEIPTGGLVPNAYYDRDLAAWVPQENGVVIKILDTRSGTAVIDMDGDNVPENDSLLSIAQFTDAELRHLAANYASGKTLWRMPVAHFTAFDFNCPVNPEDPGKPNTPGDKPSPDACPDCHKVGGSVESAQQIFHETIPLVGTPMDLHYSSARVPGYQVDAQVTLPLTGDTLFPNLIKVGMDFEIAGRLNEFNYPAQTNVSGLYSWDGYDAYGRLVNGTREGHFRMFYYYPSVYGGHALLARAGVAAIGYGPPLFGNYGQFKSTIGHNEVGQAVSISFDRKFTIPDHRKLGLGGWSLTPLHHYDPAARVLYRGDGSIERPESLVNAVSAVEFTGQTLTKIAAASDGSVFLVGNDFAILRMTSSSLLVSVTAGPPPWTPAQGIVVANAGSFTQFDGMSAARVRFNTSCINIAVGPDDSIYYRTPFEILRITPDGILHVVLGRLGAVNYGEDGTSARDSFASGNGQSKGLAVGPDGTVYYSDTWDLAGKRYEFLRKISPDGRLYTLAGKGGQKPPEGIFPNQPTGYGEPAVDCKTDGIQHVGVGPDGSVYFSDNNYALNRITPGGTLEIALYGRPVTQVGLPGKDNKEISEGKLAVGRENPAQGNSSIPAVQNFKVGTDGTVYIAAAQGQWFLWKIDAAGYLQRVAGKWNAPYDAGGIPLETSLGDLYDFTVDKTGAITMICRPVGGVGIFSLRRIGPALPGFDSVELQVASRDGTELYVFNAGGLHQRSLDTLTGTTNWLFSYDANNLVTTIRDRDGLITKIERDVDGIPAAIVGPYGQRTLLGIDGNGFLSSAQNPANESVQMTSTPGGLVLSLMTPAGNTEHLAYDSLGRVLQATDPAGSSRQWTRTGRTDSSTVVDQAPNGSTNAIKLDLLANGDTSVQRTFEDGTRNTETYSTLGDRTLNDSDGSVTTMKIGGDPRFPAQTRVPDSWSITLPGGLTCSGSITRSVSLLSPGDPLSLVNSTTAVSINGNAYTSFYAASNRTAHITSPEGREMFLEYDAQGRFLRGHAPGLQEIGVNYDAFGRINSLAASSAAGVRHAAFAYDAFGRLITTIDVLGRTNSISYDSAGRPIAFRRPDGSIVTASFDSESQPTNVITANGSAHSFHYDLLGRLSEYSPPAGANVQGSFTYHYDADGRAIAFNLPGGASISITRGPGGRVDSMRQSSGSEVTYKYDGRSGLVTNISTSGGSVMDFVYQGAFLTSVTWSGSVTGRIENLLDDQFRIKRQTVNGNYPIDYSYDRDGLLTTAGSMVLVSDSRNGFLTKTVLDGVASSWTLDDGGHTANCSASINGTEVFSVNLERDKLQRIIKKTETVQGITSVFDYTYDLLGQLVEVRKDGALDSRYSYDLNRNRVLKFDGTIEITGTYDAQDRIIQYDGAKFDYSAQGFVINRAGQNSFATDFDELGNLLHVRVAAGPVVDYTFDGAHQRIAKLKDAKRVQALLYQDELRPIAELDATNGILSRFVYATALNVPDYMVKAGKTYRFIRDPSDSVRLVVDSNSGEVVQQLNFDEFGRVLLDTNPGFQPFGFAGGLYDPDTGLIRFGARIYDPETGRWMGKDPLGFAGSGGNLYAYCFNDPINLADLTGTFPTGRLPLTIVPPGEPKNRQPDYEIFSGSVGAAYGAYIRDRFGRWYGVSGVGTFKGRAIGPCKGRGYLNDPQRWYESDKAFKDRLHSFLTGFANGYAGGKGFTSVAENLPDDEKLGYSWEYGTGLGIGVGGTRSYAEEIDISAKGDPSLEARFPNPRDRNMRRDPNDKTDHYWDLSK